MLVTLAGRRFRRTARWALGRARWAACRMPAAAAELVSAADRLQAQGRRQLLTVVARGRPEVLPVVATDGSTEQRKANKRNVNKREARRNSRAFRWRPESMVQEPVGFIATLTSANLAIPAAVSFALFAQPFFVEAGRSQILAPIPSHGPAAGLAISAAIAFTLLSKPLLVLASEAQLFAPPPASIYPDPARSNLE